MARRIEIVRNSLALDQSVPRERKGGVFINCGNSTLDFG